MIAKTLGKSLPISTKQAVEICNLLRNKTTEQSKLILEKVIEKKLAVPFKRYNKDVAHKKGKISAGRYPKNASQHILKLIKSIETNALNKGLTLPLIIKKIIPNKAEKQWHYGRQRRTKMKKTHIEIIATELLKKKAEKPKTKIINNTKKNDILPNKSTLKRRFLTQKPILG